MKRILVYSISSFLTATGGYFFLKAPQKNVLPLFKKNHEKKITEGSFQNAYGAFPSDSLISVDKFGNILVTDKSTEAKKVIYPNGQVKTFSSDEAYDTSPSLYGSAPIAAGMGWGGGGVYGSSDSGGRYFGSSSGGESQAQAVSIKKGKGHAFSEEETEKKEGRNRELASDSLGISGGLGASGMVGQGLMGGSPFSSPSSFSNSDRTPGDSGFLAMATAAEKPQTEAAIDNSNRDTSSKAPQTDIVDFGPTAESSEDSKSNEPQYITIPGAKKASNQKSSGPPPQAPDRRQNAKKAEDSANNAIPPIMNNANEEKKKADEEREKQNYQKAQEHDAKAAMLMAQAAAMAAAAAGNNKAKNKAGNDDGGGSSGPLIQTPLIFNYGDNQPKNEPQENSQPQVIAVYPNAPNNQSPPSSEIVLADPNGIR